MPPADQKDAALKDIDRVLALKLNAPRAEAQAQMLTMYTACIMRWAPYGSAYGGGVKTTSVELARRGQLQALRADIEAGALGSFVELIHSDMFDDLLGQAAHLQSQGYLVPAAVVAGATLEEHLRTLAAKFSISLVDSKGAPTKASDLNVSLKKAGAYGKPEQTSVLAKLQLRNEAAHNDRDFANRSGAEILTMIEGIREFIARHPA